MKTDETLAAKSGEAKETRAEKAIRLLTTRAANPFDQKFDAFRQFYPAVATAMNGGMKARAILKILAEGGLKLYPALFDKLMTAMKTEAEAPRCPHCKQDVPHPIVNVTDEAPATSDTERT